MKKLLLTTALTALFAASAHAQPVDDQTKTPVSPTTTQENDALPVNSDRVPEKIEPKAKGVMDNGERGLLKKGPKLSPEERKAKREERKKYKEQYRAATTEEEKARIMNEYREKDPRSAQKFEEYQKLTPAEKEARKKELAEKRANRKGEFKVRHGEQTPPTAPAAPSAPAPVEGKI